MRRPRHGHELSRGAEFSKLTNFENRRDRPLLGELNAPVLRGRGKRELDQIIGYGDCEHASAYLTGVVACCLRPFSGLLCGLCGRVCDEPRGEGSGACEGIL